MTAKAAEDTIIQVDAEHAPPSYSQVPGVVPAHQGGGQGQPPSYDDVTNPNAPPPSYNSLFGRVREARQNTTSFLEFILKVIAILIGTLGCTIICGVIMIIPIIMLVIGSIHLNDCPVEPYIPIYLVVGGAFGLVKQILRCVCGCTKKKDSNDEDPCCIQLLDLFLFAWFIAGCVWVYGNYVPVYDDPQSAHYCHKTVYLLSFWLLNLTFIGVGIAVTSLCCVAVYAVVSTNDD